jgi:hypothetical protein
MIAQLPKLEFKTSASLMPDQDRVPVVDEVLSIPPNNIKSTVTKRGLYRHVTRQLASSYIDILLRDHYYHAIDQT